MKTCCDTIGNIGAKILATIVDDLLFLSGKYGYNTFRFKLAKDGKENAGNNANSYTIV